MAEANDISARLRQIFDYDAETGLFTWRVDRQNGLAKVGRSAGSVYKTTGYVMLRFERSYYGAHRLAWLYVHGRWPEHAIDHINGVKTDNRIANLREAPRSINSQNQRVSHKDKKSCQLIGATWDKQWGNWKAQLTHKKKTVYLGRFKTPEEAHAAYVAGKRRIHEGCTL